MLWEIIQYMLSFIFQGFKVSFTGFLPAGGNRRKLSVAVALIGSPPILLLDEPSTGMDPAARRSLWVVLQDAQSAGHTIVMTSHMMEECDVLCTSVAILVKVRSKTLSTFQVSIECLRTF